MGVVTHTSGLTGAQQTKTNIDEMVRLAHNFVNIFQRCLGDFKIAPMLIPPCILDCEKHWVYLATLVAGHACVHNYLSGRQKLINSTQMDLRGPGL